MIMKSQRIRKSLGFSLVELLIAMALGLILLASATQLFKNGMDASRLVSQRTEMQDNVRAATNMMVKDLSLAGSGIPPGGLILPQGAGSIGLSLYGRDPVKTWVTPNTYPTGTFGGAAVTNFMYGLIPGPLKGMENGSAFTKIPATNQTPDTVTSIYADYTFPLNQYVGSFANETGTVINFALPAVLPVPPAPALPVAINGPGGIRVGDLVLIQNGFGSAIGEVTNTTTTSLTFAAGDPLRMNQTGAAKGNIQALCLGVTPGAPCSSSGVITAHRIYAVTYFIEVPNVAGQLPKLMRQVNAQPAQAVADDIIGLTFTYDVCDGTVTPGVTPNCAGLSDLFAGGFTPNNVHKVNVTVMGQSILSYGNHAQNMQMTASVHTRDLTFKDRYK